MSFQWHVHDPPPAIEEHSKAKLKVLRKYLRAYFDRLSINPARDEFRLDLVDGFAGGGTFRDGNNIVPGSPLIMLEECEAARERLNQDRIKPLNCDFKLHFVDVEADHTTHLRRELSERGHHVDDESIVLHASRFEDVADSIIEDILVRQPLAGRAIFLLDQTGFSRVSLSLVARILRRLPGAEVILTFAAEVLLNFLSERPEITQAVAPLELTEPKIRELIELRNRDGGKALVQRVLRNHILNITGATFDTPFYIRPKGSRRALWFLHLSRHPTARDVMIQCHWDSSNTFVHYGSGGLDMLAWDALNSGTLPLFNFEELDAQRMVGQLLNSMPAKLYALAGENPITVDAMRYEFANKTAARFSDLDSVLLTLVQEREFDILTPEGKRRSRSLQRLSSTDLIAVPTTQQFPILSRRRHGTES